MSARAVEMFPAKAYVSPCLRKLTLGQANLLLIGHALESHQGAQELLAILYPEIDPQTFPIPRALHARRRSALRKYFHRARKSLLRLEQRYREWLRG